MTDIKVWTDEKIDNLIKWMNENEIVWTKTKTAGGPRYNVFDCRNHSLLRFVASVSTFAQLVRWIDEHRDELTLESRPDPIRIDEDRAAVKVKWCD